MEAIDENNNKKGKRKEYIGRKALQKKGKQRKNNKRIEKLTYI